MARSRFPSRIFLDANVIFSAAHNPSGNARAVIHLATHRRIELVTSGYAADEARRNLAAKYPDRLADADAVLRVMLRVPEPGASAIVLAQSDGVPAKDAPILAAAISSRNDWLVTGDRTHFGHLFGHAVSKTLVLPPADAVDRLLAARP
jgi:predicted nucleic acid-binding protein